MADYFNKRGSTTLTADGAPHSFAIPYSQLFRSLAIQVVGSTAGDAISLEGTLNGTDYMSIGQLANGTFGPLAGDGFLYYAWRVPLAIRVTYTCAAIPPPGTDPVLHWALSEDTSTWPIGA